MQNDDAQDRCGSRSSEVPEYLKRLNEEIRMRGSERGRHFLLCRHMEGFRSALEAMPIDERERQELINMANVLLRLAAIKNGGTASDYKVPAF